MKRLLPPREGVETWLVWGDGHFGNLRPSHLVQWQLLDLEIIKMVSLFMQDQHRNRSCMRLLQPQALDSHWVCTYVPVQGPVPHTKFDILFYFQKAQHHRYLLP